MCRRGLVLGFLLVAASGPALAEEPGGAITVYSDDLALVREVRSLVLTQGPQEYRLTDIPARIDPASVSFKSLAGPGSVRLLEQRFEFDLADAERVFQKSVGRQVIVADKQGQAFTGTLLHVPSGDLLLQTGAGAIQLIKADTVGTIQFPSLPEGLIMRPTLTWLLDCEKGGKHKTEITYLTGGIGWHADYVAVAARDESRIDLSGWATIENRSGASFAGIQIGLVAGEIHRAQPAETPRMRAEEKFAVAAQAVPVFEETPFFDYHLYHLGRKASLPDQQVRQFALFAQTSIRTDKTYRYEGQRQKNRVQVALEFQNDRDRGPGIPLPGGRVRVYQEDEKGSLRFIGEDRVDPTPKGERVRVALGNAFDLFGERTVKERTQVTKGSRQESIEIRIRNHRPQPVTVTVVENFWGDWQIAGKTPPVRKKDAQKVEFEVSVPADGETTFEYQVLYRN